MTFKPVSHDPIRAAKEQAPFLANGGDTSSLCANAEREQRVINSQKTALHSVGSWKCFGCNIEGENMPDAKCPNCGRTQDESKAVMPIRYSGVAWRFDKTYQGSALVQILNDEGEATDACIECHSAEGGRAEDEANAKLCAAAPKLLKALEEIAAHEYCNYGSANPEPYRVGVTDGHRRAAIIARLAIARIGEDQ